MKVIDQEIASLKNSISEMWALVHQQLYNAGEAMLTGDKELAYKVISRERRVNAFELKIDSDAKIPCPICSRCRRPALRSCHVQNQHEPGTLGRLCRKYRPFCRKPAGRCSRRPTTDKGYPGGRNVAGIAEYAYTQPGSIRKRKF